MEILERFSIFVVCYWGGYVVFSVKSPGLRFIYTGECRASFTSIRAIHFMVLWPTMAMSHSWPGPVWPMSPPFQMNWMLSFTFGEGHLSAWSPPLILFTSQDRFWWRGLGCLSAASACFIHFISESFSLISSVHLDHSLLQQLIQTSITPRAFRKIPAALGKSSELIIALRYTGFALIHSSHNSGKSMYILLSHSLLATQHRIGGKRRCLLWKPCHLSVTSLLL